MWALISSIVVRSGPALVFSLAAGVLLAGSVRAHESDDQFAVAAGHYAQQRWKLAVEEFQVFLQNYPNHPKAAQGAFFLAEAQLQTGDFPAAEAGFREYLKREPGGQFARAALFRSGEAAYLIGEADLAKADLEQFQSKYPQDKLNTYVLPYLGDIALGRGDAAAAAGYYREGLSRFPQGRLQDDCRLGLARALERQNQNREAEQLYLAVAAKVGSALADGAQFHLGALQYAEGRYAEAAETFAAFETRLGQSRFRPNARLGQGWALLKLKRWAEAGRVFESILADPKVGVDARYWLGLVQKAEGHWAEAAETLLAAAARAAGATPVPPAEEHPLLPAIRFHAGDALLRAGDPAAACAQFDRVIAAEANEWMDDALRGKVQAALQAGDHQTLDREAAEFDQRFPDSPLRRDVQRMHARSLLKRKQYGPALKLLEPLLSAAGPGGQGLEDRYLLALAYQGLQRPQDALAVLLPVLDSAEGRLKSDAQLVQGSLLLAIARYGEAAEPLEAFLAGSPTRDEEVKARGELAICYARSGQLDRAKKVYAALIEKDPRHGLLPPIAEQLAEAAYEAGDVQWAAELFRRLTTDSGAKEHLLKGLAGLAWSQLKGGQLAEAAATFEKLLESAPPASVAAEAALARGRIFERLDRPDPALAMYDLVIDKYPKSTEHPRALLAAARLRDSLQQDRQAAALYERLAEEYPELPEADAILYEWAWVLNDLGQTAEATTRFERLRREHPQSRYRADATYRMARQAFAGKDYARASELASEVLAGNPGAAMREHTLYLRGQIAVAREDWDQVHQAFAALANEFPDAASRLVAEYWIAESAYRRRDYQTAGKLLEGLARRVEGRHHPEGTRWLAMVPLRRAQVLAQLDKWSEAYVIASQIEAEYPGFEQQYEVYYLIGRCLASRADFQGARDAYLRVIRSPAGAKTETAAMAQWMIGETYFHQQNHQAALREYLKVEILYAYPTWQAAALLQAAKCRDLLGEPEEADKLYTRVIKEHPGTEFAKEATRRTVISPDKRVDGDRSD